MIYTRAFAPALLALLMVTGSASAQWGGGFQNSWLGQYGYGYGRGGGGMGGGYGMGGYGMGGFTWLPNGSGPGWCSKFQDDNPGDTHGYRPCLEHSHV